MGRVWLGAPQGTAADPEPLFDRRVGDALPRLSRPLRPQPAQQHGQRDGARRGRRWWRRLLRR